MFEPLPGSLNHASLELEMLSRWEREGTFAALRKKNEKGPRFSFIDGPVTANKSLGVHTAWGRTLKDVYQRYKALRGFHQRYQNGFDCQGLWIEVGVERDLGLNSKRDIEAYGLEEFAAKCREKVEQSAKQLTEGSIRLGQWMDWEKSYFTSSEVNIEYIWRFLSVVHERGWLKKGHRATEWCPRCGTSISAHELVGSYVDKEDPSLFVRFPLLDRPGEALIIWTTTPWTLLANVAAAVNPEARYALRDGEWRAIELGDSSVEPAEVVTGAEMVGWRYSGPFDDLDPGACVEHRAIGWDEVALDEGTGIVHIAPGCGVSDFEQGRLHKLPVLMPIDEAGVIYPEYGWLAGLSTTAAAQPVINSLRERGLLVRAGRITHRYPECWRCHTPLVFRVADDWFISVDEIREPMRAANREVRWIPDYMGRRMDDWLVNMSDWNISRRRYYGMPLPFYPCLCGHLTVIGSRAELADKSLDPLDDLKELRRPWIDRVRVRCDSCGAAVDRVSEVGDVWLDAGIVPFSTLGWHNDKAVPGGYGVGAAAGLTTADLPAHEAWVQWFPANLVSEMREQIRLWFYSLLFMSVTLTGKSPYQHVLGYERMLDVRGRGMHGSHGNMISAEDAFARMGADVMRWVYCQQPPNQDLWFGFEPGDEVKRRLLTLWNSVGFFIQYANLAGFTPGPSAPDSPTNELDAWLIALTDRFVSNAAEGYESYLTVNVMNAYVAYLEDLSNWYIRRSRRRFWDGDAEALLTLWWCLTRSLQAVAPILPFITDHLWRALHPGDSGAPSSIFLAGWPEQRSFDNKLLADMATVRQVVNLGHQARAAARMKVRQPLRRMVIEGADEVARYLDTIADELRVKSAEFGMVQASNLTVRPNLRELGPRLGAMLPTLRAQLQNGEFEELPGGRFRVGDLELEPNEVLLERSGAEGWQVASFEGVTVALDLEIDNDLRLESRVYDLIRTVNGLRKGAGLQISDRIRLRLPADHKELLKHRDWIKAETLAVSVTAAGDEIQIALAKQGARKGPSAG
jgi:isoleucyl-tRNA synthetase